MAYISQSELEQKRFKYLGVNVKVSDKASLYNCELLEIGDNSRIDDFCVLSGKIYIGNNVHITPMCLVSGGEIGIVIEDFVAFAYGVKAFTQSDDYGGETMTNSTVPKQYKKEIIESVIIKKHSIVGAGSTILPGVTLGEGTSVGAMSLVINSSSPWTIIAGCPAKKIKDRKKDLLKLEQQYLDSLK